MRPRSRPVIGLGVTLLLSALCGSCQWKGGSTGSASPAASGQAWQPRPVRIRVYPSSRFVQAGTDMHFEARLELLDDMGDSIKGVGVCRFELFESAPGGRMEDPASAKRLYSWDVSMRTLVEQHRYYDAITRTYVFRLKLDDQPTARRGAFLLVTFMPAEGNRLEAQAALEPTQP